MARPLQQQRRAWRPQRLPPQQCVRVHAHQHCRSQWAAAKARRWPLLQQQRLQLQCQEKHQRAGTNPQPQQLEHPQAWHQEKGQRAVAKPRPRPQRPPLQDQDGPGGATRTAA